MRPTAILPNQRLDRLIKDVKDDRFMDIPGLNRAVDLSHLAFIIEARRADRNVCPTLTQASSSCRYAIVEGAKGLFVFDSAFLFPDIDCALQADTGTAEDRN